MSQQAKHGRLGNPDLTLITDRRTDPRIAALIEATGSFSDRVPEPVTGASVDDCIAYTCAFEEATESFFPAMFEMMPSFETINSSTEKIKGFDGNTIALYLHLPESSEPGPCVIHMHGGGMVMGAATDPGYVRWRNNLAASGIRVVGVEFRNGGGKLGNHPFPAGLDDCCSAVNWVHENRDRLGVTAIIVSGESGGGNLAIVTAMKAKNEGWVDRIDGVYACCPYIFGDYLNPAPEMPSLVECDGYAMTCTMMSSLVKVYDPAGAQSKNPLAWPYHASREDLQGLPPHVISVNELDPLRDEGLEFYRKLMAAGVDVIARTVHGTPHAGDLSYPDATPDLYAETLQSLCRFSKSLG